VLLRCCNRLLHLFLLYYYNTALQLKGLQSSKVGGLARDQFTVVRTSYTYYSRSVVDHPPSAIMAIRTSIAPLARRLTAATAARSTAGSSSSSSSSRSNIRPRVASTHSVVAVRRYYYTTGAAVVLRRWPVRNLARVGCWLSSSSSSSEQKASTDNDDDDDDNNNDTTTKANILLDRKQHQQPEGDFPVTLHYYQDGPSARDPDPNSNHHPTTSVSQQQQQQQVMMHDARQLDPPASLDRQGFALASYPSLLSSAEDFQDAHLVHDEYYGEVRDLVRELTGATQVGVYDHAIIVERNIDDPTTSQGVVVHCDYTEQSAPLRLLSLTESRELLMVQNEPVDPEFVTHLLLEKKGFCFVNVWRSIGSSNDNTDHHENDDDDNNNNHSSLSLAVCDARSVPKEDRIRMMAAAAGSDDKEEIMKYYYALRPNAAAHHQWYAYPRMQFHESLVYKVFDTQEPKFVFHSSATAAAATTDQRGGGGGGGVPCNSSKSIEVRTIAFFDGVTEPPMDDLPSLEEAAARY